MKLKILIPGVHTDKEFQGGVTFYPITGTVTLIQTEKHNILIDTGSRGYADKLIKALKKEKLKPDDIDYVVLTHRHLDHSFNCYLFAKAIIVNSRHYWKNGKCERHYNFSEIKIPNLKLIQTSRALS